MSFLQALAVNHSQRMKLYDASEKFGLEKYFMRCGKDQCKYPLVEIADFTLADVSDKPTILLFSGIHGDEVVGIQTVTYYLQNLLELNQESFREYF